MNSAKVTVLGLGLMGSALARALLAAGLNVTVWNRNLDKAKALGSGIVSVAQTIEEAIAASSIIVVCVRDYAVTRDLLSVDEVEGKLSDKVIIQLSTGTPTQAREAAAWATTINASYIDGAIMAFPDAIGKEDCVILYAGDANVFEFCQPVVQALGGISPLVGDDPGSAAGLDNGLLSIYFSFLFGVVHGAAICDAENVPLSLFKEMGTAILPVMTGVLTRSVDMIAADNYESEHSTLVTSASAINQVAAVASGANLDTRFIKTLQAYASQALDAGHGSVNNAVLFKQFRKQ
ncbi:MAG TPA: NAD(P)-binding domain-containing protein [Anaerolineae bacterium]|jgi:3-hydroxyisobutyrate dehydrogenase-like beta-hydroxyacid dehydrogenase|nr:NAD(P)-binding domain-containing protein [Anaerolineae bacterium]